MIMTFLNSYVDALVPGALILVLACLNLLLSAFCERKANPWVYYLTQLGLLIALALILKQSILFSTVLNIGNGRFQVDHLSLLGSATVLMLSLVSMSIARQELSRSNKICGEYYALALFSILGMLVMVSASHFLTLYIGIELLSFPLYILCAYYRESSIGTEAALKYFITGALSSGFLLYGISLVYGVTQNLGFAEVGAVAATLSHHESLILLVGIAFVLSGFAFKLGLAPFHMWLPDVYEGAPLSIVTFLSGAPKLAVLLLFARLLETAFLPLLTQWDSLLAFLAILSVLIGNIAALTQKNLRRLLAYSSIAQMGFVIMGFLSESSIGFSSALFYMISYAFVSVGFFSILSLLNAYSASIETVEDLTGLSRRYPLLAFILLLLVFSMAGIPPLVGFMAKLSILEALIQGHYIAMTVFMAVMSIVGLYYYLTIIKAMYFEKASKTVTELQPVQIPIMSSLVIGLLSLLLGLFPQALLQLCL